MPSKKDQKDPLAAAAKSPRILAIDLVRIFVVATVIITHVMATGPLYDSVPTGLVWMLSHTSRNIFILLSALVLMYSYLHRPVRLGQFYRKRFLLILLPYAAWTFIYQISHGIKQGSVHDFFALYLHNFLTAEAMYHLYFLLITMQLYLLFPLLRYLYEEVKKYPWHILGISLAFQLIMTAVMQYGSDIYGLSWWLNNPDNYILGYQFYIVAGMLIAAHLKTFEAFIVQHFKKINVSSIAVAVGGIAFYLIQIATGTPAHIAAAVFQPYLVIESILFGLTLFGIGMRWVEKGMPAKKLVDSIAQDSFGIYLCHVFILSYFELYQPPGSDWLTATATLIIMLPVTYTLSYIFTEIVRHTWISILITGRHYVPIKLFSRRRAKLDPSVV